VAILADPRSAPHAVVLSMAANSVEESGALRGAADGPAVAHVYMIPVAASAEIGVGFVAQRLVAPDGSVEFFVGRFAVDNTSGALWMLWGESLQREEPLLVPDESSAGSGSDAGSWSSGGGGGARRARTTSAEMFCAVATMLHGTPPRVPPPSLAECEGEVNGGPTGRIRLQYIGPRMGAGVGLGVLGAELEDVFAICDAAAFRSGRYTDSIYAVLHTPRYERYSGIEEDVGVLGACGGGCETALIIPGAPLDYDAQIANVIAHIGRYRGRTEVNIGVPGAVPRSVRMFKKMTTDVRMTNNPYIAETMRQIVLQCRMKTSSNLRKLQIGGGLLPQQRQTVMSSEYSPEADTEPAETGSANKIAARKPVTILPRPEPAAVNSSTYVDAAREERRRARREANRAAAARSNARRKSENDKLKTDIAAGRAQIDTLRKKEVALLEMNRVLKSKCGEELPDPSYR
jgi:hypothetical protein